MGVSSVKVVTISLFLILGMLLAGLLMQPKGSSEAWNIKESDFPVNATSGDKALFLVNYAILAPSTHNSQPWKFNISENTIRIFPDRSRWLQVADADQRELFISLGCALENLLVAAEHFGYSYNVTYITGETDPAIIVELAPGGPSSSDSRLFEAILSRQTSREPYEDRPINDSDLQILQSINKDWNGTIYLTSDSGLKSGFKDLIVQADQFQYSDPNYKSELGHWLSLGMMGPTGIQAVIAQLAVVFLDMGPDQAKKDAALVNSTPILGIIGSEENDRISQIKAGQAFERLWLEATAQGLSVHPMSQTLEVSDTKAEMQKFLPTGSHYVQQAFRLGYSKGGQDHTPRRPLQEVLA
jgi:nitroreductase